MCLQINSISELEDAVMAAAVDAALILRAAIPIQFKPRSFPGQYKKNTLTVKFPPYWCHLFIKLWFIGKRIAKRKMLPWGSLLIKTTCRTMSLIQIPRHTNTTTAVVEWVGLGCLQLAVEQDCIFYIILYATNMQEVQSH